MGITVKPHNKLVETCVILVSGRRAVTVERNERKLRIENEIKLAGQSGIRSSYYEDRATLYHWGKCHDNKQELPNYPLNLPKTSREVLQ
jgi:hypothetical protein